MHIGLSCPCLIVSLQPVEEIAATACQRDGMASAIEMSGEDEVLGEIIRINREVI